MTITTYPDETIFHHFYLGALGFWDYIQDAGVCKHAIEGSFPCFVFVIEWISFSAFWMHDWLFWRSYFWNCLKIGEIGLLDWIVKKILLFILPVVTNFKWVYHFNFLELRRFIILIIFLVLVLFLNLRHTILWLVFFRTTLKVCAAMNATYFGISFVFAWVQKITVHIDKSIVLCVSAFLATIFLFFDIKAAFARVCYWFFC